MCDTPPAPLSTEVIAALFGVTPRAVRKGISLAARLRGGLRDALARAEHP